MLVVVVVVDVDVDDVVCNYFSVLSDSMTIGDNIIM
jgi:hypothetical protein